MGAGERDIELGIEEGKNPQITLGRSQPRFHRFRGWRIRFSQMADVLQVLFTPDMVASAQEG